MNMGVEIMDVGYGISLLISVLFFLLVLIALFKTVHIVPQSTICVVERLGRFHRVLHGGLNFVIPFVDSIRETFTTQEQVINLNPQRVITKDNVSIIIDGLVFIRVQDGMKATYGIQDLELAIAQLAQTTLRAEIGRMELDDTLSSREQMNASLQASLDSASAQWGTKITRVEISDISVPQEIQDAMEMQLKAVRERRAIETKAGADKNAAIAKAEGERQRVFLEAEAIERMAQAKKTEEILLAQASRERDILNAQGQQEALALIGIALTQHPNSGEFLLTKDRIKAWNGIAASDSQNKIVVPYEASELLGSLSVLADFLGKKVED